MNADDELCFCFHVTWRKVINYLRQHPVKHASQIADCYGAGTGCGWCRKQITRLMVDVQANPPTTNDLDAWLISRSPSAKSHAEGRVVYLAEKENQTP